jgi:hypothetical protein
MFGAHSDTVHLRLLRPVRESYSLSKYDLRPGLVDVDEDSSDELLFMDVGITNANKTSHTLYSIVGCCRLFRSSIKSDTVCIH